MSERKKALTRPLSVMFAALFPSEIESGGLGKYCCSLSGSLRVYVTALVSGLPLAIELPTVIHGRGAAAPGPLGRASSQQPERAGSSRRPRELFPASLPHGRVFSEGRLQNITIPGVY